MANDDTETAVKTDTPSSPQNATGGNANATVADNPAVGGPSTPSSPNGVVGSGTAVKAPTQISPKAPAIDPTKQASSKMLSPPPFSITPLGERRKYIKCLFYAKYGDGKTSLAASAVDVEEMRDVLLLNVESGAMSIETASHIEHRDLIDEIKVTDFKTVVAVHEFLVAHNRARDKNNITVLQQLQARLFFNGDLSEAPKITDDGEGMYRLRRYRTIIVDSLTEIDALSMYQLLGIKVDVKLDAEIDIAQFPEFRKNNQMMQLLVRAYRDLEMNVLIVAAAGYIQDELKQMFWAPALTGKLASQIQGFVDIVGFLQTGKPPEGSQQIPRRLWIQPVGRFDAKSRLAMFKDPNIDQPTMAKIMNIFNNRITTMKSAAPAAPKK